jgi:polyvinyl alcohol dehydrogenase (cytochrome)
MIRRTPRALLGVALFLSTAGFVCQDDDPGDPVWAGWGGNVANTHHAAGETAIGPDTVAGLRPLWSVTTGGNVSAIPSLSETRVYFPDWGIPNVGVSQLWTVDRATGDVIAQKKLVDYSKNLINNVSRTTPAIYGDLLIFGDIRSQPTSVLNIPGGHGAVVYAVSRITGELVWKTTLDDHPLAIITQSPTVHGGVVYVGTSSHEEAAARLGYPCCSFRGTMAAIEASTGAIKWRTRTIPDQADPEAGFSGGSVWGSAPSVDAERGVVYVATGNNYRVGAELEACIDQHPGDPEAQETLCYQRLDPPDNYAESILALDLDDGAIRWARKMKNYGAWTFACDPELVPWLPRNSANCEDLDSMDYDFGQAPMIVRAADGAPRDLLVLGQKSGVLWALDPDDDGATVWATAVGPGGVLGGMEFGSATDGQRAYVQITNFRHNEFQLVAGPYAGQTVRGGIWAAVDLATGAIVWQTPDPTSFQPLEGNISHLTWGGGLGPGFFGVALGPLTVANGVVFAGSMDREGHMYGFDAATGLVLWSFASGGSVNSAPAIHDGVLYWGSGYSNGFNNDKVFAFGL